MQFFVQFQGTLVRSIRIFLNQSPTRNAMIIRLLLANIGMLSLASCIVPVEPEGRPTQLPQRPLYSPSRPGYATQLPGRYPVPPPPGYVTQLPDRNPVGNTAGRLTAHPHYYGVVIRSNGIVKTHIRTAMPNVERYAFARGDTQIIVKSRGNHGPATVEMFETATGALRDKILSFAVRSSGATWAYGFED